LAQLIPSHATLQVGIGNVFSALPSALRAARTRELQIWTEILGDGIKEMLESGVAQSAVAAFAYGSTDLYTWLNNNTSVKFAPFSEVNAVSTVSNIPNFHALNSAFQVALSGEGNAMIDPAGTIVSGVGGQPDFMQGATASKGGKAIIALRSTAAMGDQLISRIAPYLYYGPITTPAHNISHVVTEYGIAELVGKNRSAVALSLIAIAHPSFRSELLAHAIRNGQVTAQAAQSAAPGLQVDWAACDEILRRLLSR
jgi:acyl-CoA hydrolase